MTRFHHVLAELKLAAKFGVVSVVSTSVDVSVFWLLASRVQLPPVVANIAAYSCGIVVSFTLNRLLVFTTAGKNTSVQFGKFVVTTVGGLGISTVTVGALVTIMSPLAAKLLSLPLTFMWNFALSRIWVFEHRHKADRPHGVP